MQRRKIEKIEKENNVTGAILKKKSQLNLSMTEKEKRKAENMEVFKEHEKRKKKQRKKDNFQI